MDNKMEDQQTDTIDLVSLMRKLPSFLVKNQPRLCISYSNEDVLLYLHAIYDKIGSSGVKHVPLIFYTLLGAVENREKEVRFGLEPDKSYYELVGKMVTKLIDRAKIEAASDRRK